MRPSTHSGESRHPRLPSPAVLRKSREEPILLIRICPLSPRPSVSLPRRLFARLGLKPNFHQGTLSLSRCSRERRVRVSALGVVSNAKYQARSLEIQNLLARISRVNSRLCTGGNERMRFWYMRGDARWKIPGLYRLRNGQRCMYNYRALRRYITRLYETLLRHYNVETLNYRVVFGR